MKMPIIDKVRELGEEIIKGVEETGIKEKAKCATMLITEVVEESVKEIETRFEENMNKIELEKKMMMDLCENLKNQIIKNYNNDNKKSLFKNYTEDGLKRISLEFFEKIIINHPDWNKSNLTFGNYIQEKKLVSITNSDLDVTETNKEFGVIQYYKNSKNYFLLTNKYLYFKGNYPNKKNIYSTKISTEYIHEISFKEKEYCQLININGVPIGCIDSLDAALLNGFIKILSNGCTQISDVAISNEIKSLISDNNLDKIYSYLDNEEYFTLFITTNQEDYIICTNKNLFMINCLCLDGDILIEKIPYNDISSAYIDTDRKKANLFSMFTAGYDEVSINLLVKDSKHQIDFLKIADAYVIVKEINDRKSDVLAHQNNNDIDYNNSQKSIALIRALSELRQSDIITEEEFQNKKMELLNRI